jgi:hypothetical protein
MLHDLGRDSYSWEFQGKRQFRICRAYRHICCPHYRYFGAIRVGGLFD